MVIPRKSVNFLVYIVLTAFGLLIAGPFIWMVLSSFKHNSEIQGAVQTFFPRVFTFDNYKSIYKDFNFLLLFRNSLFLSALKTLIVVYTSLICGYVFSKLKFFGRDFIFYMILGSMMIPMAVRIIPMYQLMQKLGWIDSYASLIIPELFNPFGIFLMRQFMLSIPDELIDAAKVDGANEFYILHKLIFPLSRNAVSAVAIFQFLWVWEDFLWPYLMITSENKQLLSIGLQVFTGRFATNYGGLFAATTISILPVLIIYFILQKRFIEGVTMSGVKG